MLPQSMAAELIIMSVLRVFCSAFRIQFSADAIFSRELDDGLVSRIPGYFHTRSHIVTEGQPLDLDDIVREFAQRVEAFTKRGSGYVLDEVVRLSFNIIKYRPLTGSSYLPTPEWLRKKKMLH